MDCAVYSVSTYPLDGDLSGGYPPLKWLSLEFRSDYSNWGLQDIQHSTKSELQVDLVVSFVFSQVIATKFSLTYQNSFFLIPSFFILNNSSPMGYDCLVKQSLGRIWRDSIHWAWGQYDNTITQVTIREKLLSMISSVSFMEILRNHTSPSLKISASESWSPML